MFGVSAQGFMIKGGLNLSKTLYFSGDTSIITDRLPGFNAGVLYEFKLTNSLYQTIGISYSQRGYKVSDTGDNFKYRFNYIDIPINILYKFDLDDVLVAFEFGPYAALGLNGRVSHGDETKRIYFGSKVNHVKRFDVGINVGYSIEYECVRFGAYYYVGFINISNSNSEWLKNRSFCFSLGYVFN